MYRKALPTAEDTGLQSQALHSLWQHAQSILTDDMLAGNLEIIPVYPREHILSELISALLIYTSCLWYEVEFPL